MNTRKWNTREIILAANMGLVFGVLFLGWNLVWALAKPLEASGLQDLLYGFWFIAAIVVPYIVRKPGAALAAEVLAALAEMLAGGQWGATLLLSGLIQGGAAELIFAATGWKNYRLPVLIAAGVAASVGSFVVDYVLWYSTLTPAVLAVMFVARLISGALLAGWLGKTLTDALARTGVLSGYAIGRE
jgi:energy-coupling factor transport system permease protein